MRATKPDPVNDAKPVENPTQNPTGIVEEEEINIENGGDAKAGGDKAAEESSSGVKSLKPTIQSVIGNKWIRFGAIGLISLAAVYKLFISPMDDRPTKPIIVSAQNANPANAEISLKPRINGQIAAPSAPNPMLNQSELTAIMPIHLWVTRKCQP